MTIPLLLVEPPSPLAYATGMKLMRDYHAERVEGGRPDTLLLLEHAPVITLGRNASEAGVVAPLAELRARGVEVHRVERGGQATCHLPGQLVAYPVVRLRERNLGVRSFVLLLEEAMISAASSLGLKAYRLEGVAGVWCDAGKLGAVGVAVKSGVTMHGIAFNVNCDLDLFRFIVPCGRADLAPASLVSALGREVSVEEGRRALLYGLSLSFGDFTR